MQRSYNSMETSRKVVCVFFLFCMLMVVRSRSDPETHNATSLTSTNGESENRTHVDVAHEIKKSSKDNFGGQFGWGWGGGGGGGLGGGSGNGSGKGGPNGGGGGGGGVSKKGGWGGGWGGGGGGSYKWGCQNIKKRNNVQKRDFGSTHYKIGEFAQCMVEGRCKGMKLDCPLHCGGPCYYDCRYMCKAHCRRKF